MLAEYVYLGDQLLAMIRGGQVYYFHNDHLGTPQVLTNDSQAIAWKAVYTPFGEAVPSIQTVENPHRYLGQIYDPETGLHYNYFRYYNPQTGRYITPDPIGLEGGINLYIYVQNNPQTLTDPYGLTVYYCFGYIRTYLHAYVCVDQDCAGLMPYSKSECPKGGIIQREDFNSKHCSERKIDDPCCDQNKYENCVRKQAIERIGECGHYNILTHNCIDWAKGIIRNCQSEACKR